jgi:hypothetical protein
VEQVLVAAALGAHRFTPFLASICEQERDGHAALVQPAACGIDTFTISLAIASALFKLRSGPGVAAQFERGDRLAEPLTGAVRRCRRK